MATVVVVRFAWTFVVGALPRLLRARLGRGDGPPWVEVLLVGFTGMRGAVSVAAALAIPLTTDAGTPLPGRDLIIFLTYVVVVVTVVGQGLALPRLLRRIAPEGPGDQIEREEDEARVAAARAALAHLDELGDDAGVPDRTLRRLRELYRFRLDRFAARLEGDGREDLEEDSVAYQRLRHDLLERERRAIIDLRDEGRSPTTPCAGSSTTSTSTSRASRSARASGRTAASPLQLGDADEDPPAPRARPRWPDGGANGPQRRVCHDLALAMSPVEQLTADRPLVPALTLARPRARALVVVGGARPGRADVAGAVGADLRPVGLDHLGPRDPAPRPEHVDGPVVEAAARPVHDAVRAGRRRSRPTCGSSSRAPARWPASSSPSGVARRLGGGVVGGRRGAPRPARIAPWTIRNARAGQLRGPARRASCWAPSTATSPAAAGRPSRSRSAPALLRPEAWPFLGLYGAVPALARARACGALVVGAASPAARAVAAARAVGLGRPAAGDAPRARRRAPTAPAFAEDPARAVIDQFAALLTPAAWLGVAALVAAGARARPRPRTTVGRATRPRRRRPRGRAPSRGSALVAYMTSDGGFSGNPRYLILPATLAASCWRGTGVGLGAAGGCAPRAAVGATAVALAVPRGRPASPCRAARGWRRRSTASPTRRA